MRIDLVTAHPDLVQSPLQHSILRRAQAKGLVEIVVHDLRAFGEGPHRQIDDYPFGGRGGMVLTPGPLFKCVHHIKREWDGDGEVIYLTPDGEVLAQPLANRLSLVPRMCLIAGHYKGIDERVRETLVDREISIGDYVLSGGELPALILIDAVVRLIPAVLGDAQSALSDSFQDGLLDAPTYTRPAEFEGMRVPDVLLTGDHEKIRDWRDSERLRRTRERRPDLLENATGGTDSGGSDL
jgi:tRNA (guanine37-N1)-methyltransferase